MAVAMGWYVTGPLALKLRATDPSHSRPHLGKTTDLEVLAQSRKGAKFFGESPSPTIHPNPNPLFLCVFAPLREPPFFGCSFKPPGVTPGGFWR